MDERIVINAKNLNIGQGNTNKGTVCIGDNNSNNVAVRSKKDKARTDKTQYHAQTNKKEHLDKTKVFIVHGHDTGAKLEVARFIEKMGFEPIILNEQAKNGMTIIEMIEKYSNVGFAIVLYTPCDVGYAKDKENEKKDRARQNVVFEHGYLIGKLGRNNVCALVRPSVEIPTDISGVFYIPLDDNGGWKIPLVTEMKNSGYKIDFNLFM